MRLGLLGGAGQVGFDLQRAAAAHGIDVDAPSSQAVNITQPDAVDHWVRSSRCDAYVNCAAYTAVDAAEDAPDEAFAINRDGAGHLAAAVAAAGGRLICLSTDYVFAGTGSTPWTETATTDPQSVYGASKLAGEAATLACPGAQVLRVSWVFGLHGHNFVKSILRAASRGVNLEVVDDQHGTPCSAASIAATVVRMLQAPDLAAGVYHFGAEPLTNWCDFARAIVSDGVAAGVLETPVEVAPCTTESRNQRATRPRFSQLDGTKLNTALGIAPADWRAELQAVLSEMAATGYDPS